MRPCIIGNDGDQIASLSLIRQPVVGLAAVVCWDEIEANANFIVKAVNSHDALLAACKELRHAPILHDGTLIEVEAIRARADAAIALAEKTP
jgi:hypothetical protein